VAPGTDDAPGVQTDAVEAMIAEIARGLVDHPDAVRVVRRDDRGSVRLELHVAPEDRGQVIGRGGRSAHALRVLLRAAQPVVGAPVALDIVD
jgi:hypothetical protein